MRMRVRRLVAAVVATAFLSTASLQPVMAFSIADEREIGEKLLYSVRSSFPLVDDPDLVLYLGGLGKEVLEVAGLQYFDYRFYIIRDKEFNAFAAPSGLIFFYSGLIASMQRENELVSVLAHEIGHVAKRHLAGRMEKGMIINVASLAVALAGLALGGGAATQAVMTGSLAAGQSASLHFSRKDEEEADLLAYDWMKQLSRDPEGQRSMLETMRRVSRYRSEKLPQYLLTHPNPEDRLDYVQNLISMDSAGGGRTLTAGDEFAFLRFKYRIMAQTTDSFTFREYLASVGAAEQASPLARTMATYGLAQLDMQLRNYTRAIGSIDQVIAAYPDRDILRTDKGVLLYNAGNYAEAKAILEESTKRNPNDMYGLFYLAKTCQVMGDIQTAENLYRTVSYAMPEYSKVFFELGKIASGHGKRVEAGLYLGRHYLLEGKLESARFSLDGVVRDKKASSKQVDEANELLTVIDRLEEDE